MPFFPSPCVNTSSTFTTAGQTAGYCILILTEDHSWHPVPSTGNCISPFFTCDAPNSSMTDALVRDGLVNVGMCILVGCKPLTTH